MIPLLLLLTTLSIPEPEPWTLTVGVEREGMTVWLSAPFESRQECMEGLAYVSFSTPTQGRVVDAYCEPPMRMT